MVSVRVDYPPARRAKGERMNPKRRFFQIHLSTAVVLMLVAGVLVWANVTERTSIKNRSDPPGLWIEYTHFGWPFFARSTHDPFTTFLIPIALDVLIGFLLLVLVWVLCE